MAVLNSLASASGARAFLVAINSSRLHAIDDVLDEIAADLRNQYTIGFYPDHPSDDGKWHQVVVQTRNNSYDVRSRKEYFGARRSK